MANYSNDEYGDRESNRMTIGGGQAPRFVPMDPSDTVLHVSSNCCTAHDELKLLQNGSDINARNRRGRSPLAAPHGRTPPQSRGRGRFSWNVRSMPWLMTMIATSCST